MGPPAPLRILLVDDFENFRRFIRQKLEPTVFSIVDAVDGLEAVQKAEEFRPDLVLLDIGLPKLNGLETARRISRLLPEAKIIFLSHESSNDIVMEALRLGGHGYIHKTRADTDLLPAIDAVLRGTKFISKNVERSEEINIKTLSHQRTESSEQNRLDDLARVAENGKQQYERFADAAVAIMRSEFSSIQYLDLRCRFGLTASCD